MRGALLRKKYGIPAFILVILIASGAAAAAIYWMGTQTLSQRIKEVASGTATHSTISLPNINEGESATYDTTNVGEFDQALRIDVSKPPVTTLSVKFENPTEIGNLYDSYQLKVMVDTAPAKSGIATSTVMLKVDLNTATASHALDTGGTWKFDYEVTVTAGNVTSDTDTNAEFTFEVK